MNGRVPVPLLQLIVLFAIIFVQCFSQEEYCSAKDDSCTKDKDTSKLTAGIS